MKELEVVDVAAARLRRAVLLIVEEVRSIISFFRVGFRYLYLVCVAATNFWITWKNVRSRNLTRIPSSKLGKIYTDQEPFLE